MSVKDALAGGGWLVALVVGLSSFVGGAVVEHEAKPVQDVEDFIANAPASRLCPAGWRDTSSRDEHTVVMSCSKDGWLVIVDQGGGFQYALQDGAPAFETDARRVIGWP